MIVTEKTASLRENPAPFHFLPTSPSRTGMKLKSGLRGKWPATIIKCLNNDIYILNKLNLKYNFRYFFKNA